MRSESLLYFLFFFLWNKLKRLWQGNDLTNIKPYQRQIPTKCLHSTESLSAGTETGPCGTEESLYSNVSTLQAFRCQTLSGIDCLSQLILTSDAFQVGGRSLHSVSHQHSLTTGMWCQFVPSVQRRKEVWI